MESLVACSLPTLTEVRDVVTILALAVGAWVAMRGLRTWRRQLKGTSEHELAKRVLKCTYRLRDALAQVRFPVITPSEAASALKQCGVEAAPEGPNAYATVNAAVYHVRWRDVADAFRDLEVEAVEVEALWGRRSADVIMELRKNVSFLSVNLDRYLVHLRDPEAAGLDTGALHRVRDIIYRITDKGEEDEYSRELSAAIAKVEQLTRPHLLR